MSFKNDPNIVELVKNFSSCHLYSIQYENRILIHVFFLLFSLKFSTIAMAMLENFNENKRKNSTTQFSDFHTEWSINNSENKFGTIFRH